jgi:hypothetical protein
MARKESVSNAEKLKRFLKKNIGKRPNVFFKETWNYSKPGVIVTAYLV